MARVSTYLNFPGNTFEAFEFYRSVFGTDYVAPPMRMGDVPSDPSGPQIADAERDLIMHIHLPTLGDHSLMGTDTIEGVGALVVGNNVSIMLQPDSRAEADRLHAALSAGGSDVMPMQDMFWGDYYGACCDRFGIHWMVNCEAKA